MSRKCPYCGSLRNVCVSPVSLRYVCFACEKFFYKSEQPKRTVFENITSSIEVPSNKLVYQFIGYDSNGLFHGYWKSTITDEDYTTKEKAIAATLAELKKEVEMSKTCPRCGTTNSQDLYNGFWHCRECCKIFSKREAEAMSATAANLKEEDK